ncbi:MAG: fumarate hydratase [Clostridia bacterium]
MVKISTSAIKSAVTEMFSDLCSVIDDDVLCSMKNAKSSSPLESFALGIMIQNAELAKETHSAVCQDTGMAVVFVEIGQDVILTGEYLEDAINSGVSDAYIPFRKSVLTPLSRQNTLNNAPAVIHTKIVVGDKVKVSCMAKGFGSENMSRVYMLTPADGVKGIIDKTVETVKQAGGCPCPPIIIGIGIGGTMEKAAIMSKHALFRPLNSKNNNGALAILESEILESVNALNIGAQGFGGNLTALKVLIETYPTHIAGLPLAITIQCHCSRHAERTLEGKND